VPVAQALVTLTVFERVRVHFGTEYEVGFYLGDPLVQDGRWSTLAGVGAQWISPFAAETRRRVTVARRRDRDPVEESVP
jgi:hypothetical protein